MGKVKLGLFSIQTGRTFLHIMRHGGGSWSFFCGDVTGTGENRACGRGDRKGKRGAGALGVVAGEKPS